MAIRRRGGLWGVVVGGSLVGRWGGSSAGESPMWVAKMGRQLTWVARVGRQGRSLATHPATNRQTDRTGQDRQTDIQTDTQTDRRTKRQPERQLVLPSRPPFTNPPRNQNKPLLALMIQ